MSNNQNNPFLDGKQRNSYNAIPFNEIQTEHFLPAVEEGLTQARADIEKIKANPEAPNFKNTIEALEMASELLDEVTGTYFNLFSAESDAELKALAQEISPKLAQLNSSIMMDSALFERIKAVYNGNEELNAEQKRLLEVNYKSFVRNGALLNDEDKKKLDAINTEMAKLSPQFSQNLLNATNAFELHITDEEELSGLPQSAKDAAAFTAKSREKDGWVFTLQAPSVIPVLTYADKRELREKISRAYSSRAFQGEFDNQEILKRVAVLRHERAQLLGFDTHAQYTLKERMAETPETVVNFLERILEVAKPVAEKEVDELKELAQKNDQLETIYGWDASYYGEKLKKIKYDFDEEELRPYFKMENVVDGLFKVANKLYGLQFAKEESVPVYHPDVMVYKVTDTANAFVGLLYIDLFPRETKRGGAWMTTYRTQGFSKGEVRRPHVSVVANVTPSTDKQPSLLRLSEVTTLFHEFGHALHGLLSDCYYKGLASPNVYWDFVELPSQILENWVTEKEALDLFAKHYETNEPIPAALVDKVKKAQNFQKGMFNVRQLTFGFLDMAWHNADPSPVDDVVAFEEDAIEKTRLYPKVEGTNTSCAFGHIFAGGYSAGYYSYKWAEVLEADAFELFQEKGIFDAQTAASFRDNVLARGNTKHPMELYVAFRGQEPDPDALLRRDGLLK